MEKLRIRKGKKEPLGLRAVDFLSLQNDLNHYVSRLEHLQEAIVEASFVTLHHFRGKTIWQHSMTTSILVLADPFPSFFPAHEKLVDTLKL